MRKRSLKKLPSSRVSHNPEISKKVMIESGQLPGLTTFSRATLRAGQVSSGHLHDDMFEVFFVGSGRGTMTIDGADLLLEAGDCVVVEPGERHEIRSDASEGLELLYFGLESGGSKPGGKA